jgi:isopenicillin-N N-acyltransferase-like protein
MSKMNRLIATGSPAEVGQAQGSAFATQIREYADDRVTLSSAGTDLERDSILEIANRMLKAHEEYDEALFIEMIAMADAADISPEEAVIVGGYTDFIDTVRAVAGGSAFEDTCTAIITSDSESDGAGFLAQTWDMHASATPHVFMLDVETNGNPRALVFTTHGTLGQIGMNSAGLSVGINNLTVVDGCFGVTWPFVVRRALKQTRFEDALASITEAPVAGAHSFLLFDSNGRGAVVEATPTTTSVEYLDKGPLIHTNHCLAPETIAVEAERPDTLTLSSTDRISQARELLTANPHTQRSLMAVFSDERSICRHPDSEFNYETSGAAIMRPATGDFWACWGRPSENGFEHYSLPQRR